MPMQTEIVLQNLQVALKVIEAARDVVKYDYTMGTVRSYCSEAIGCLEATIKHLQKEINDANSQV